MAVDVVVINYKTPDLLVEFCQSYERYAFPGCTLTAVDVASPELGAPASAPGATSYMQFFKNVGYARACNAGALGGENDVILLANADTQLSSGFEQCYEALMAHDDWGVLGPRQVDQQNRVTAGGIFGTDTSIGQRGWHEPDNGQYSDIRDDAKSVSGSLYFIKRSVWGELTSCSVLQDFQPDGEGAFLHTPHYYEETACSYHARAHGYKIVYYGPVKMLHHWHAASDHGAWADQQVETSKAIMRNFCLLHEIQCE